MITAYLITITHITFQSLLFRKKKKKNLLFCSCRLHSQRNGFLSESIWNISFEYDYFIKLPRSLCVASTFLFAYIIVINFIPSTHFIAGDKIIISLLHVTENCTVPGAMLFSFTDMISHWWLIFKMSVQQLLIHSTYISLQYCTVPTSEIY